MSQVTPVEHKITPDNESLSPEENKDLSTNSNDSGDIGHAGDKSGYILGLKMKKSIAILVVFAIIYVLIALNYQIH
jgi:hypothetical protein